MRLYDVKKRESGAWRERRKWGTNLAFLVWNPYLDKDVLTLEEVQRRASRLALGQKRGEMEYEDRLRKLKWPTLETRNLFLSIVECYKIVFGMNKLNLDDLFNFTKGNLPC